MIDEEFNGPHRINYEGDPHLNARLVCDTLFLAVQYVYGSDVHGHVIEFGTMTGNSATALASAISFYDGLWNGGKKDLYLLDSFRGFPLMSESQDTESPHILNKTWKPGACVDLDPDQLRELIRRFIPNEKIRIYKGWFKDTLPIIGDGKFSVVHVDCDLYESTMDSLGFLFEQRRISEGAIILFDDWNANRADPRYGERAAWRKLVTDFHIDYSDEGGYGTSGHKFIVHYYGK